MKTILAAAFSCAFLTISAAAGEPAKTPAATVSEKVSPDPKAPFASFLDAMRRCDLDAAVKCVAYEEKDAEAIRVAAGIFISHRRFGKALEAKFGLDEKNRALFEGWLRLDVTDAAIDASVKRLARATVKVGGDSATAELRWSEAESGTEDYLDLPEKKLRNVDGVWKIDGYLEGEDFFKKGGWGRMFRNIRETMNQTADKLAAGEFRTVEELKAHLDVLQKAIEQEYEKDLRETDHERATVPGKEQ